MSEGPTMNRVADLISFGAIVGTFAHMLPTLAALIAVVWYCIEILESKTVMRWRRAHRHKRIRHRRNRRLAEKFLPAPPTEKVHDSSFGNE